MYNLDKLMRNSGGGSPMEEKLRENGCSCGTSEAENGKQPINIFNEIAYLTEHMSNLGEDEVQRIIDEFLAEHDAE